MAGPNIFSDRYVGWGLNEVGAINTAVSGIEVLKETGVGPVRQTVLKLTNVPLTMTDNGSNGSGSVKLYTFPVGVIQPLGSGGKVTVSYASVTDANVIASLGTAAAAADATLTSTEINFCPSSAAATTSGTGTFNIKATQAPPAAVDGTSSAAAVYLNMATSTDPSTNNSITLSGTVILTWVSHGKLSE